MENQEAICVVDDDQGVLDSFDAMLGDDYPLLMADNGIDAMTMLKENTPRLLFLDIKMPGLNGFEVLRRIRENDLPVRVVVITALPQDNYEVLAEQYGVYKYLRKPFDIFEVEEIATGACH